MWRYVPFYVVLSLAVLLSWPVSARPELEEACTECHDKESISEGDTSLHPPFEDDECTECHLDHGDEERLMLAEEGNALCASCHDFSDGDFTAAHGNVQNRGRAACLSCHDPHRSLLPRLFKPDRHRPLALGTCNPCHRYDGRLIRPTVRELCLTCHLREKFLQTYVHPPVAQGDCLVCHDQHGSSQRKLLKGSYSGKRWIANGEEDYELCLGCHDPEMITADGSAEKTRFRNGWMNLHQRHVGRGEDVTGRIDRFRGFTCRNCHDPHSSSFPRLIRAEVDCDGVPCLKIEFRRRPDGGECAISCHGPKAYARSAQGEPPAIPEAAVRRPLPKRTFPARSAQGEPPAVPEAVVRRPLPKRASPAPPRGSLDKKCISCHEKEAQDFKLGFVHDPVAKGNCSACHLDHGPENRLILLSAEYIVCSGCHDPESAESAAAHHGYSLEESRCSECHDPHAASNEKLLYSLEHEPFADRECTECHGDAGAGWRISGSIVEVCTGCHDDKVEGAYLHTAIPERQCTGCHRPHAGERERFLRAERPALCFRCHQEQKFSRENVHPPVEDGECEACHRTHGADNPLLFAQSYSLDRFIPFNEENFTLCWECHSPEDLLDPENSGETNFKVGERNLHALHVRDKKSVNIMGKRISPGITCRNCHYPHSTDNPHLIRRNLDCDGVPCLKLDYRKEGEGGTCRGGCHGRRSYAP